MNAKCACQHCDGHIEFDASQAGQTIPCPHCCAETALLMRPALVSSAPALPSLQSSPGDKLKVLRGATAYRRGRIITNGICAVAGIGAAISVIYYFALYSELKADASENGRLYLSGQPLIGPDVGDVHTAMWIAVRSMIGFAVILLIRQAIVALLDVADCAIRGKWNSN